ncbi:MAG: P-loop NTPase [Nitriliruptorales bacterium]|nr:P-loop NTPase [Nitriliruptorales bacterium]
MSSTIAEPPGERPAGAEQHWRQGPSLLAAVWRHRALVAVTTVLAGLAGYGLSQLQPAEYEATSQLFLTDPRHRAVLRGDSGLVGDGDSSIYAPQQAEFIESHTVLEEAAALLGGRLPTADLERQVDAAVLGERSLIIGVTATAAAPQGAAEIANTVAQAYQQVVERTVESRAETAAAELEPAREELRQRIAQLQQEAAAEPGNIVLEGQVQAVAQQLLNLEARVQELMLDASLFGSGVEVFEEAVIPDDPVRPASARDSALAALLGLGVATAYAYRVSAHSQVVENRTDPRAILGVPLLGEIPAFADADGSTLSGQLDLDAVASESYQFLLASIEHELEQLGESSLLITGAAPGDGKTTTALQLAMSASRDGRRVVLVDTDIRGQGLTQLLGVQDRTGLTELALSYLDVDESVHYLPVSEELLLPVVAAGGRVEDPGGFFRGPGFRKAVHRIKDEAELVILDSSPLLAVADTSVIAEQVGGVVLVVNRGAALAQLEQVRERLAFVSSPLLGYVYNRSEQPAVGTYDHGHETSANGRGLREPVRDVKAGNGWARTRTPGAGGRGRPKDGIR